MSRYIDADALIKKFGELTVMLWLDSVEEAEIVSLIGNAPSIDIVRCGECKYWEESQYYPEIMVCTYVKGATFTRQHDDFCSRGERRES